MGHLTVWSRRMGTAALLLWPVSLARGETTVDRIVEIRSYNLKAGTRDRFHERFEREALPMLRRFKVDVVAYGPSLHDRDSYFLMRSFASVEDRQRSEDAFYGSDEWRQGPREAVLADIESYTTVVVRFDDATLRGLRRTGPPEPAFKEDALPTDTHLTSDVTTLVELNRICIRSVTTSNVERFKEILADDFLCSFPDGSLVDRDRFLEHTALLPFRLSDLEVHDINVRVMGDFAIIHARTTFTTPDGRPGSGLYTDVWARRDGRWLAVAAHVTRK
jgi:hypothetical protein